MTAPARHSIAGQSRPIDQDMDWSQIGESLAMLALAVAQIDSSLTEGSKSVNQLSTSFTAMADNTQRILEMTSDNQRAATTSAQSTAAHDHAQTQEEAAQQEKEAQIQSIATEVNAEIKEAIIAFQFYDRLSQRLEHVGSSLEKMGHLIADPTARYAPGSWSDLQQHIKGKYTMEAERIMFEHIMAGNSVAEALEIYHHHFEKNEGDTFGTTDEIELF